MADQSLEKGSFAAVLPWVGLKPSAKGEGTRGGHVIGHTRSGKPIYAAGYRTHQDLTQPETHDAADIHEQAAAKLRREISKYKNRSGIPVNAFAEEAAHHHDPKVRELVAQHTKEMAAAQSYRSGARAMTRPGALLQSENPMRGMDDLVSEYLEKAEASGNSPFGRNTNPEEEEAKKPGESLKPELPEQGVSPNKQAMPNQKPGKEGAPGGESLAGKLPAPSIHEDRASLEAALSKVSHLGEKGFRSLHPDTQQELISDGYLDPQGNLTAAGHKELVDYFAKHAANPNLGPQAQQKAQMRHQAHTEAAGQEASGHPAVHATWQQKQIEMRSGGMAQPQQGQGTPQQAPGMAPSRPPMPQGAPQMGGQASRPMPPQGSIPGQPGPLGMAPRSPMGAPSGASVGARPPMPPAEGAPQQRMPMNVTQGGGAVPAARGVPPAQAMPAKQGSIPAQPVKPAKPMPPQFQKSGLDDLGDYLEKAMGGGHKYIKRTGGPGSYRYFYATPKGQEYEVNERDHFKRERAAARKQGFGQQSLPMGGQAPATPAAAPSTVDKVLADQAAHAKEIRATAPPGLHGGPTTGGPLGSATAHQSEAKWHNEKTKAAYSEYHSLPTDKKDERSLASLKAQHHNAMEDYHNAMSFAGDLSDEARPKHLEFAAGRKKEADQHKAEMAVFQDRLDTAKRHAKMAAGQVANRAMRQQAEQAGQPTAAEKAKALAKDKADLARMKKNLTALQHGHRIENLTAEGALSQIRGLTEAIGNKEAAGWGGEPKKYTHEQKVHHHALNSPNQDQIEDMPQGAKVTLLTGPDKGVHFTRYGSQWHDASDRLDHTSMAARVFGNQVSVVHPDKPIATAKRESKPAKLKTVKIHQSGGQGNPPISSEVPVKHHVGNLAVHKDEGGMGGYHVTHIPSGMRVAHQKKLSDAKDLAEHIHAAAPNAINDVKFGEYPDPKKHNTEVKKMQEAIASWNAGERPVKKSEGLDELGDYLRKADKIHGGLADKKKPSDFDPKALAQGMKVEMEHTDDPQIAKEIAMDHLTENSDYYSRLKEMEEKMDAEKKMSKALPKVGAEGGHKTPLKEYREGGATGKKQYADPNNFKYPIDDEGHVRAAISYFSKPKNAGVYSTSEQKAIWGRIRGAAKKFGIELGEESGPPSVEKCMMSKSGLGELGDYLEKAAVTPNDGMPDKDGWDELVKPQEQTLGGSANGGDLTEHASLSGDGTSGPGEGQDEKGQVTGTPAPQTDIFGDDRPAEQQMTEGKTALEEELPEGYKSMTPANQRAMVAKEHAQKVAELQKSRDVRVGGKVHPYSMQATHGGTDEEAASLCKSEFYANGVAPTLAPPGAIIRQTVLCKSEGCGCKYPALLTSCPSCGDGMVKSRMLPKGAYMGGDSNEAVRLEKAVFDPIIKPAPVEADVHIPGPSPVVTRRSGR